MKVEEILAKAFQLNLFSTASDGLPYLSATYTPGKHPLLLITGENATGKSLMRRVLKFLLGNEQIEGMDISMQRRSTGGIERAFIYGDENTDATGNNSSNSIVKAMKTSHSRTKPHAILYDEPDIGLSDAYAAGAGVRIAQHVLSPPSSLLFVSLTTHRRIMVEHILKSGVEPHHVAMGKDHTLEQWLNQPAPPADPEELFERNHALYRRLTAVLKT